MASPNPNRPKSLESKMRKDLRYIKLGYRGARPHLITRWGNRMTPFLVKLSRSKSVQMRYRASWLLGNCPGDDALKALLDRIHDTDQGVAYDAQWAIGKLKTREAA